MATDIPAWAEAMREEARTHKGRMMMRRPVSAPRTMPATGSAVASAAQAIRGQVAATGHNTFRPDIYRVSEGYLS